MSSEEVVKEFLESRDTKRKEYCKNSVPIQKASINYITNLFEQWLPYLTVNEEAVIILYYFKNKKIYQVAMEINYSETQIKRILKSARRKINKLLP